MAALLPGHRELDAWGWTKIAEAGCEQARENPSPLIHGKRSTYQKYGCRCAACKGAEAAQKKRRYAESPDLYARHLDRCRQRQRALREARHDGLVEPPHRTTEPERKPQSKSKSDARYGLSAWKRFSADVRRAHRERFGDVCPGYRRSSHATADLTVDHLVPLSQGGDLFGTTQVLCRSCNSRKRHFDSPHAGSMR